MQVKRKIPSFIFGLSIGLLIGLGFFIFKLDDYFNKIKFASSQQIKVIEQPVKNNEEGNNKKDNTRFKINTKNSPYTNYKSVDSLINTGDADINVAREVLLSVKNIKLIDLDSYQKDTLTEKLAGINTEHSNLFFVEFWKTPLNSKGYRMTKNKIILYGFSDFSSVSIYKVDDGYYLKNREFVYKLVPGSDFMQMEKVNDSDLLAKIN